MTKPGMYVTPIVYYMCGMQQIREIILTKSSKSRYFQTFRLSKNLQYNIYMEVFAIYQGIVAVHAPIHIHSLVLVLSG